MHLRRAGNAAYQQLAVDSDVITVARILVQEIDARGPVAAVIRGQVGKPSTDFATMMKGLAIRLSGNTQSQFILSALQAFYDNAQSSDEVNMRRGMVLELATYLLISKYYLPQECMMQCHVYAQHNASRRVNMKEVDICAWNAEAFTGEAYECKTKPYHIFKEDCDSLVAIQVESEAYAEGFRIGVVSYDSTTEVEKRLDALSADARLLPFGWDSLDDLTDPIGAN